MPADPSRAAGATAAAERRRRAGLGLVLLSAAGFGSLPILGKQAYAGGLGVADVLLLRFALAAPLLWALALAARRPLRQPPATVARLLAMGALGYCLQATLFFSALARVPAGVASLLLYLYPALVTAGAVALGRHRIDRATVVGLGLALAGTALVLGLPAERLDPVGVALGLAAAAWYTLYMLVGEALLRGVDALVAAAWVTTGAAGSFLAARAVVGLGGLPGARPGAYAAAAAMALLGTAVAIAAFFAGLTRVGSAWAAIASSFEPVFTVALGVAVLGDRLGPGTVAGGTMVVAGAVLLPLAAARRRPRPLRAGRGGVRCAAGRAGADVDGAANPMVSSRPDHAPTRGSTRR